GVDPAGEPRRARTRLPEFREGPRRALRRLIQEQRPPLEHPANNDRKEERREGSLPSMAMAEQIEISEMTWTEVDEAMKDRPVALVPVGATEAHGPHLPLNADTVIATEMARRGAAK